MVTNALLNKQSPYDDVHSDSYNDLDGLDRFLSIKDVLHHVGIGKSTVYKLMNADYFPKSFRIQGTTTVVWSYAEIKEWMSKQRIREIK